MHCSSRSLLLAIVLAYGPACTPDTAAPPQEAKTAAKVTRFELFPLGMDEAVFKGKNTLHPELASCQTRGIAVMGRRVYITCALQKGESSRSMLLATSLPSLMKGKPDGWQVVDITTPGRTRPQASLGYPSNVVADKNGVWVATAALGGESLITRYDATSLLAQSDGPSYRVDEQIHTVMLLEVGPTLVGFTRDNQQVYRFSKGAPPKVAANESSVVYQDCVTTKKGTVCAGQGKDELRLDRLNVDLTAIPLAVPSITAATAGGSITAGGFTVADRQAWFLTGTLPGAKLIRTAWPVSRR